MAEKRSRGRHARRCCARALHARGAGPRSRPATGSAPTSRPASGARDVLPARARRALGDARPALGARATWPSRPRSTRARGGARTATPSSASPRAARPPPRRPPDRRRLLLRRPPGRLGEGRRPLAVGAPRASEPRRALGARTGSYPPPRLRPDVPRRVLAGLVAGVGGELEISAAVCSGFSTLGEWPAPAIRRRAHAGHGGVGLERGVGVVDLVLGAEDHHQRHGGGPHPGVERRLVARSPRTRRRQSV